MMPAETAARSSFRRGIGSWCRSALAVSAAALSSILLLAGCGSTDDRPATWSYVSTAILEPSCATANCHSAIAARASVDLSDRAAGYRSLVGGSYVISRAAVTDANGVEMTDDQRVIRSAVPQLMRAVGNLRMPPDLPLPEIDIELFEKWIRAGAAND
jgi:hypothetical protein